MELWNHCSRAGHRHSTLRQVPANEGTVSVAKLTNFDLDVIEHAILIKELLKSYQMHVLVLNLDNPKSGYGLSKLPAKIGSFWGKTALRFVNFNGFRPVTEF